MDFFEVIEHRQSVRKYLPRPVEETKLQQILKAVNGAPSAGNFQAYEVYVVRGQERTQALAGMTFDQKFIAEAPVALVFCTHAARCQYEGIQDIMAMQDASVACTFAMLALEALGLATCWVGAFVPAKVAAHLGIPDGQVPMAILPIGYANETPERTTRRELSDLVHEVK